MRSPGNPRYCILSSGSFFSEDKNRPIFFFMFSVFIPMPIELMQISLFRHTLKRHVYTFVQSSHVNTCARIIRRKLTMFLQLRKRARTIIHEDIYYS